jgi:hypothetical protein
MRASAGENSLLTRERRLLEIAVLKRESKAAGAEKESEKHIRAG